MSAYDQINNIPKNSFQLVDVCNLPIYFDTTQNQSDKYEFKSPKSPISILKTGDLQKPVIRFARLIGFSNPNSTIPEYANAMLPSSNLYTVYCDIDNKYLLYTTDESNNNYSYKDFLIPVFPPAINFEQYSALLQIQRAPVAPIPTENEAFRFAVELFNSKNRQNLSSETATAGMNNSGPVVEVKYDSIPSSNPSFTAPANDEQNNLLPEASPDETNSSGSEPIAPAPEKTEASDKTLYLNELNFDNSTETKKNDLSPESAPDETNKSAPEKSATLADAISSKSISLSNPEEKKSEKTSPATDSPDKKQDNSTAAKENSYTDELTGLKIIFDDGSEEKKKKNDDKDSNLKKISAENDPFSPYLSFHQDRYGMSDGTMGITTPYRNDGDSGYSYTYDAFTNFIVIPQSIDCTINRDGTAENEVRLTVYLKPNIYQTITVKPNKTGILINEIQKIFPQACLEPFVKCANKHLSAYISKMLAKTPLTYRYRKSGWNMIVFPNGQRSMFYCNDAMEQNAVFSTETGKRLDFLPNVTQSQAFYFAVKMLALGNMTKTLPLFLFSHIGVMYSIFEEAGFAPNFLLNIVGHTGSLKTSVSKIFFKILRDNRNDIASSFNDTATAMEIKMGNTFDEVLLIDDFRPSSNKTETSRMRNSLEKLVRYFGDGVGKSRGNPLLTLNKEFRPHGVCAITGEYLYGVPSSLLRMLIVHVNRNTFDKKLLKFYQDNPLIFPTHIRFFIDYLQANYDVLVNYIRTKFPVLRDEYRTRSWESRLVQTAAWLDITAEIIFKFYAVQMILTSPEDAKRQYEQCKFAISEAVNESNELATNTSPEKMFLNGMTKQIRDKKLLIAESKNAYKQNTELYAGFIDREKRRLFVRPTKAFNSVLQYCDKMDMRFTETERSTRQALIVNGYIQGQSEDDKENTSYVVRLDNNKEVRMLAFYLDKLENEYGKIPCCTEK